MPRTELVVPGESAGERLDVFLAEHAGSRTAAQHLIEERLVTVDGQRRPKRHTVAAGEVVVVEEPDPADQEDVPDAAFVVVHEDEHLLVVEKPAGVVVHPGTGNRRGTLAQALAGRIAGGEHDWRAGIVHRLDRDTSGLLVMARTDAAYARLKDMIRDRGVVREYLALVEGRPAARAGTIDAPIGRDRRVRSLMSTETDDPRDAVTHFETEQALEGCTLLRVRLETGRTHQIRAHLKAIGNPVAGDPEYGRAGLFGLRRQFLHAARLAFAHPVTGEALEFTSPLPEDLAETLRKRNEAANL